jgi:contractile injection system tube protein/LysM domain-containing protein
VVLYFDVTQEIPQATLPQDLPDVDDVRKLTQRIAYYITPTGDPPNKPKKYIPPAVRFLWGSFQFDGIMESLEETLELFSFEGKPLRASVSMALSQQRITEFKFNQTNDAPGVTRRGGNAPGTTPMSEAPSGSTLQGMAAANPGSGMDWQSIAAINGIENPRLLAPGQLIDLSPPSVKVDFSL